MTCEYRITTVYTQTFIIEGEGDLACAEKRAKSLMTGLIDEGPKEVSSFRNHRPRVTLEVTADGGMSWMEVTCSSE